VAENVVNQNHEHLYILYGNHDFGSTPTLITYISEPLDKVLYDDYSAWWFPTSNKLTGKKSKKKQVNSENGRLLHGCGFIQNIEPPSLSCDRRLNMKNKTSNFSAVEVRTMKSFSIAVTRELH